MTHLDFLRNVSLFESLDQQELEALSDVTFTRTFSKDNVIIFAEEEGDTLFILKKGQVKVSIVSEEGREVILSLLGPGSVLANYHSWTASRVRPMSWPPKKPTF